MIKGSELFMKFNVEGKIFEMFFIKSSKTKKKDLLIDMFKDNIITTTSNKPLFSIKKSDSDDFDFFITEKDFCELKKILKNDISDATLIVNDITVK